MPQLLFNQLISFVIFLQGSAQSQPLPLQDKTGNKQNMKDGGISNGYQSPDAEDSNKFSFNVTYVPSSSVTKDTEIVINY